MLIERRFSGSIHRFLPLVLALPVALGACADDGDPGNDGAGETGDGDGDGDPTTGDGDGDPTTGDGDGDPTTGGDGDPTTGDGDGDPTTGGDGDGDPTTGDGDGDPNPSGAAYDQPGPYSVSISSGQMATVPGCNLSYGIFEPATLDSETAVFLAHGFMRSIDDMADFAEHIASWGVKVYTVPLCTNSFVGVDHEQNGEAMAALGDALEPGGSAVYAGFSAGGLAAFVAATQAGNAVGYVGLDSVDNGNLALNNAAALDVPAMGSIAEPGQCNTNNNFLPVYDAVPNAPVMRIVGAQHFDFEAESCGGGGDLACSFCAPAGPETHALAVGMTTAAMMIMTGADLGGSSWWEVGGTYFDMYAQQGKVMLIP